MLDGVLHGLLGNTIKRFFHFNGGCDLIAQIGAHRNAAPGLQGGRLAGQRPHQPIRLQ